MIGTTTAFGHFPDIGFSHVYHIKLYKMESERLADQKRPARKTDDILSMCPLIRGLNAASLNLLSCSSCGTFGFPPERC